MATKRVVMEWQDANLGWMRTAWNQVAGSSTASLITALLAHSNATFTLHVEGDLVVGVATPVDAWYPSVSDVAQLEFCTDARNIVRLAIPAPKQNIFFASGNYKEVDLSTITDIRTAAIGVLADSIGNPVTRTSGGVYVSRRKDQ